jgi:cell division protein FtsZ
LLESNDISGAQRVLLSIAYSPEHKIKLSDQTLVTKFVESQIHSKASLFKHGFATDSNLGKKVRVTIVAAGFDLIEPEPLPEPVVEKIKQNMIAATMMASVPQPTASVGATVINTSNAQNPAEETTTYAEINEPKSDQKDTTEQIKAMIQRFMREGYRNPALNTTPTYVRNGVELQDIKKLRQNGRVLEYELDQLLAMMETLR